MAAKLKSVQAVTYPPTNNAALEHRRPGEQQSLGAEARVSVRGVIEGSIIATIITAHMRKRARNSAAVQGPECGMNMLGAWSMWVISQAPRAV